MTHDERISSYIDNELSSDQEQEFLISLAASDGLRKSFRSELVLKNVLHRDEAATNPPRKMRGAIFGVVGLAGAGLTAGRADAAQHASTSVHASSGFLKTMFATKINALLTAATITVSGFAGYGVHSLVEPAPQAMANVPVQFHAPAATNQVTPTVQTSGVKEDVVPSQSDGSASTVHHQRAATASHRMPARVNASGSQPTESASGTAGGGSVGIEKPEVNRH
jgi:hypothetical protein